MTKTPPTIHSLLLDGRGGARRLTPDEVEAWTPEQGILWLHLNREDPGVHEWIQHDAGLDPLAAEVLLASNSRPRVVGLGDSVCVTLRGVNLNPGAEPEDMISLRLCVDGRRIITLRRERLMTIEDVIDELDAGRGPTTAGAVVSRLTLRILKRTEPVLNETADSLDDLEDWIVDPDRSMPGSEVLVTYRRLVAMRKFLAPQRAALTELANLDFSPFSEDDRQIIGEAANRAARSVEELDALRERSSFLVSLIQSFQGERLGERTYLLTVVAGIVLPLSLLTGLLGINVGGIPLASSDSGFLIVTVLMILTGVGLILFAQLRKWL